MKTKLATLFTGPMAWSEAVRAALCMLPMALSPLLGLSEYMVPFGQAGFFYSTLPLPKYRLGRIIVSMLMLSIALSFYLLGGNIASNITLAIIFTFFVGVALVLLSGWNLLSILSFSFIAVFSAGLNAGNPDKAASSFIAFAFAIGWGSLISLLPFFKGTPIPEFKIRPMSQMLDGALRMGTGMSLALYIAEAFSFSKFGWAPSAVGSIVRFDLPEEKKRAWIRLFATVVGVGITATVFLLTTDPQILTLLAVSFAIINGLLKNTPIGKMPLLYTATILMLYSMNDPSASGALQAQRIAYNTVGIVIAMLVIWYPFPFISKRISKSLAEMKLA